MNSLGVTTDEATRLASLGDFTAPASENVVAMDGIAVIVHPNIAVDALTIDQLEGIFGGQIKNWKDPLIAASNPGLALPDLSLVTVVRQDSSGTTYAVSKNLDAVSDAWRSRYGAANVISWPGNAMRAQGNEGVAGRIQHRKLMCPWLPTARGEPGGEGFRQCSIHRRVCRRVRGY